VNRLLTVEDLMVRLDVPESVARKILKFHGDIQVGGRAWRMTEGRYEECIRNKRFRTSH
jgi:hypothetical protein